jgi:hypothetical protein
MKFEIVDTTVAFEGCEKPSFANERRDLIREAGLLSLSEQPLRRR